MSFPVTRPRRLRRSETIRSLARETRLSAHGFIYPMFVCPGQKVRNPIASMPGVAQQSVDQFIEECREVEQLGIPGIILFGIPEKKDPRGSEAYAANGVVQRAIEAVRRAKLNLLVMTDVCLCEYTDHGHCGIVAGEEIVNDPTVEQLVRAAVSHAAAGADIVAPSDMMDGRVGAIRAALDAGGFSATPIVSYAAKYASAFYGPFREAAGSAPAFGDRRSYQMDPANGREALKEVALDLEEGADIIAPSDMMDGRVGAIRKALDGAGFEDIAIMSYAAKYCSGFYGPFREAADSVPQFGDRRGYQMDPSNAREALREVELDLAEGADMVMVKPALAYLDIIQRVREAFTVPVGAYNVSGEFAMVKAAAANGWIEEKRIALEILTGIQRAGASIILTYHAKDAARWLKNS